MPPDDYGKDRCLYRDGVRESASFPTKQQAAALIDADGGRYVEAGLPGSFKQDNVSVSRRGVLRGLHFQSPVSQGKLVTVLEGEVFDVASTVIAQKISQIPGVGSVVGPALGAKGVNIGAFVKQFNDAGRPYMTYARESVDATNLAAAPPGLRLAVFQAE